MSQKELAERIGKNPNTITSICNNKSLTPPQRIKDYGRDFGSGY